jgi:hypothetical protein
VTSAVLLWSEALQTASDRAMSQEARKGRNVRKRVGDVTPSVSVDQAYDECLESLRQASEEAARPNWDGHGGHPVSSATLAQALTFLDLLPTALPKPDISPHPDGELAFEWYLGPRQMLTVSINESGRLSYAAMFGQARTHGTEYLLDALPEPLVLALRRLHSSK